MAENATPKQPSAQTQQHAQELLAQARDKDEPITDEATGVTVTPDSTMWQIAQQLENTPKS